MIPRFALLAAFTLLVLGSLASIPSPVVGAPIGSSQSFSMRLMQDAGDDLDCVDFDFQEDAQEVLDTDPSDPNALDPNQDGIACALLPARDANQAPSVEIAQDATPDAEADRAARQAERDERRNAREQEGGETTGDVVVATCDNFATQADAQAAFQSDPAGLVSLDPDGNGVACEELPAAATAVATEGGEETREERRNRRNQNEATVQDVNQPSEVPVQATAPEDLDCIDFQFQEEAQSILDRDPSDPFNLDPNGDGFACSSLPSATPRIVQVPRTGAGASQSGPIMEFGSLVIFAGMALLAAGLMRNTSPREDLAED